MLNNWFWKQCIPVAKTNHFELVIIAVSNHLSKHNFQITRNTVGADKAVEVLYKKDGTDNFPCQLQAYLMGKSSAELASVISSMYKISCLHPSNRFLSWHCLFVFPFTKTLVARFNRELSTPSRAT